MQKGKPRVTLSARYPPPTQCPILHYAKSEKGMPMSCKDRTKRSILDAVLALSDDTGIDHMTTADICRKAGVSRQTFYSYFKDKYEVTTWYLELLLEDNFMSLGQNIGWRDAYLNEFINIEDSVHAHPNALKNLFDSEDYNAVLSSASRTGARDFSCCYRTRFGKDPDDLLSFQIKAFARTASLVSTDWIRSSCSTPADKFIDKFITLIPRELFLALDVPRTTSLE